MVVLVAPWLLVACVMGALWPATRTPHDDDRARAAWQSCIATARATDETAFVRERFDQLGGSVLDAQGRGVADAAIAVVAVAPLLCALRAGALSFDALLRGQLPVESTATSGADGHWSVRGTAYGSKLLLARAGTFCASHQLELCFPGLPNTWADVRGIERVPRRLVLRDGSACPLTGAEVRVVPERFELEPPAATATAAGDLELALIDSDLLLVRRDASSIWHRVPVSKLDADGSVPLEPVAPLEIEVVGADGRAPDTEFELTLQRPRATGTPATRHRVTATGGSVRLADVPHGSWIVRASFGELVGLAVVEHPGPHGRLELTAPAEIRVSGAPIGAALELVPAAFADLYLDPLSPASCVTWSDLVVARAAVGEVLRNAPAGSYRLFPYGIELVVAAGERPALDVAGAPPVSRLFTDRPGELLEISGGAGTLVLMSDLASEVQYTAALPGPCVASAITLGGIRSLPHGFIHGAGREVRFNALDLRGGEAIARDGFVLTTEGAPVTDAEVLVQPFGDDARPRRVETDEHGFWRVVDLAAGTQGALFARHRESGCTVRDLKPFVLAGVGNRVDLTWNVGEVHAQAAPASHLRLERAEDGVELAADEVDASGELHFLNVPAGRYVLRAEAPPSERTVEVTVETPHVDVTIGSG